MKITVKLLSTYREKLPEGTKGNTCTLDIQKSNNINDVLNTFDIPNDQSSVVLINGLTPKKDQTLIDGDEVCVFSAMAGG